MHIVIRLLLNILIANVHQYPLNDRFLLAIQLSIHHQLIQTMVKNFEQHQYLVVCSDSFSVDDQCFAHIDDSLHPIILVHQNIQFVAIVRLFSPQPILLINIQNVSNQHFVNFVLTFIVIIYSYIFLLKLFLQIADN